MPLHVVYYLDCTVISGLTLPLMRCFIWSCASTPSSQSSRYWNWAIRIQQLRTEWCIEFRLSEINKLKNKKKKRHACDSSHLAWLLLLQYSKRKKIVTGRDSAAAWQIALLAITYDGHSVLTQLILGDQSVVKRVFLSRRQTPTIWIQTLTCYFQTCNLRIH